MTSDQALYLELSGLMIPCAGSSGGERPLAPFAGAAACAGRMSAGDPEDDEDEEEEKKKHDDDEDEGGDDEDKEEPWQVARPGVD